MTFWSAMYKLLIGPLELLFEVIFALANRVVHHPGLAIIALSLAMNFLVLPLYRRADAMQAEERDQANKLKHWVDHIKKTFKGDERFMMLQTYYRQNNYKQTDALKGSVSLLLEIPFFIAAYRFLSGLMLLQGVSFGPIRDLGSPDALIILGGLTVNLLPILMTAINVISAAIYMKGFPLKSKIQMYGMALIFLILLYNSPSGLVFYWTLNNVFSLLKNIFYKLKNPGKVLRICASVAGLLLLTVLIVYPIASRRKLLFVLFAALLLQLPLLLAWLKAKGRSITLPDATRLDDRNFLLLGIFLALLTGVLIPSAVIEASTEEFIDSFTYCSPLWYMLSSALLATGTFVIWFGIFYRLASAPFRKLMGLGMWVLAGAAVVDYMFFGTKYGDISPMLVYDNFPLNTAKQYLINLFVLLLVAVVFYLIWKKKSSLIPIVGLTLCLTVICMSAVNVHSIRKDSLIVKADMEDSADDLPVIPLSKNGKNVIVLMMDRAIGFYVPYIMEEDPEIQRQFEGFTFYPNSVTYATSTNVALPAVFGGYEYLPAESNKRSDVPLVQKQNESLLMMPVLFDEAGYEVTVCDPSYAGYRGTPDLRIYNDYPDIHAYNTRGKFAFESDYDTTTERSLQRNFFCYSIFKIAPLICQPTLYTRGLYNQADALAGRGAYAAASTQTLNGLSKAYGMTDKFREFYAVLLNLANMTEVREDEEDTFLMMCNEETHQPTLLQLPDYTPAYQVDNTAYDSDPIVRRDGEGNELTFTTGRQITHYHVDMAGLKLLGQWFDYLRENDLWDNTRIIIVSDHGFREGFEHLMLGEEDWMDVAAFNCLLMVKDFGSTAYTVDKQFMTNADVPMLTMDGLIEDPVNPFTGVPVSGEAKNKPVHEVQYVISWDIAKVHGNVFEPAHWFSVHDEVLDVNNWRYLGDY